MIKGLGRFNHWDLDRWAKIKAAYPDFGFLFLFFYGIICFLAFTSWRWAKAGCLYVDHVRVEVIGVSI